MSESGVNPEPATALDGASFARIEQPASIAALAEIASIANEESSPLTPIGGGTLLDLGNRNHAQTIAVSTLGINRVLAFEPADLTFSVEAGTTLAEINRTLGERGQWLPIDSPFPERATIGGLIATAFSGPRRLGSETIRDLIVGISVVHANGAITKAGGTVVKNVTGFDMMRLYHGSLGTLGIIASANFKVLPRPRAERTLLATFASVDAALAAGRAILASRCKPVALDVISRTGAETWTLACRFEGRPGTIAVMEGEARPLLSGAALEALDDDQSRQWWQSELDRWHTPSKTVRIRLTSRPRLTDGLVKNALAHFEVFPPRAVAVSPGLGRVDLEFDFDFTDETRDELLRVLYHGADNLVVLAAPPAFKTGIDIWGRTPETLDVMQALKREFDPNAVFNRGRFAGFI